MPNNKTISFDVVKVPLLGKNLVEASAGTGKTYSIAILVLRMIVEKEVDISQQLIVTFTNFAVAELQERIRHFLKQAYDIANRSEEEDKKVAQNDDPIIRTICLESKVAKAILKDKLRAAMLTVDEASILTIHGFCQQMLHSFAFETQQNFEATLQNDVSDFINEISNEFWRKELSTLPVGLFDVNELVTIKTTLQYLLKQQLGKVPTIFPEEIKLAHYLENSIENLQGAQANKKANFDNIIESINIQKETIVADLNKSNYAKNKYSALINNPKIFIAEAAKVFSKPESIPGYYNKFTSTVWHEIKDYLQQNETVEKLKKLVAFALFNKAIENYYPQLETSIQNAGILTFDAIILKLHEAIVIKDNKNLRNLIRAKYPVVFIDEFQDTDVIQFQLFDKLFFSEKGTEEIATTLFLIGDPKQSIYAFRNADIDSYLSAATKVDTQYSMDTNFRSSKHMIDAANSFFEASGSQVFGFDEQEQSKIIYQRVLTNDHSKQLLQHGQAVKETLILCNNANKDLSKDDICNTISYLLNPTNGFAFDTGKGVTKAIEPQDIAVLTGSRADGKMIKEALHKHNIPAVNIDENTVLHSAEARDISLILKAMLSPSIQNVKAALYLTFINKIHQLATNNLIPIQIINEIDALALFNNYSELANQHSVYQAMAKLLSDFSVQQIFSKNYSTKRSLANILQLTELLHQQQYRRGWSATELAAWLRKAQTSTSVKGDEYLMQIESDELAVNILTIHKSKGLEFPIVITYGLNRSAKIKDRDFYEIKTDNGTKQIIPRELLTEAMEASLAKAEDQENRRLIYVAITRAVYQCYLFYSDGGKKKDGTTALNELIAPLNEGNGILKTFSPPVTEHSFSWEQELPITTATNVDIQRLENSKSSWALLSFSSLAIEHEYEPKLSQSTTEQYDQFIFNQLPRGAEAGTKLHELFEKIDFTTDFSNIAALAPYEKRNLELFNKNDAKNATDFTSMVGQMLHHVMNASITIEEGVINLSQISQQQKLHELEFEFPLNQRHVADKLIPLLGQYDAGIQDRYHSLSGMMTGYIDLLFEYNGKYYILDWKSNYLGFSLKDYQGEHLKAAMQQNQYNLQYLIYTLAIHKFLRQRLGKAYDYEQNFGGVIYIFIRGARAKSNSGIFTDKPSIAYIEALETALKG